MDSDLDPFADLVSEKALNNVRAAKKFQPKGKLRPGKANMTSRPSNANEKSKSGSSLPTPLGVVESVKTVDTVDDGLTRIAGLSVASSTLTEKEEVLGNSRETTKSEPVNSSTQVVARIEDPDSSCALPLKVKEDSSLVVTVDSLQSDLHSLDVPNSSASEDNKSKEPISVSLATSSVPKEPRKDHVGVRLDELDSMNALKLENRASDGNSVWSSSFMKSTEDLGSLGLDLDPLADPLFLPSIDNARVVGKFKPKAKIQPRKGASEAKIQPKKGASEAIVMPVSSGRKEEPATVATVVSANMSAEFVEIGGGELTNSVDSSLPTSENLVNREPPRNEDYMNSGVISTDPHSVSEKPIGENADIFVGLEYIHDFVTQSPNNIDISLPPSNDETERQCRFPTQDSGNSSVLGACNTTVLDSVTCNESVVRADDGRLQSEDSGSFFDVEMPDFLPDSTNVYESCSRKFQPKLKVQNGKEKPTVTDVPQDAVGSVAPQTETQFVTSETVYGNEGSIPAFPSDEVLDYSSMSFSNFIPPDAATAELPMTEEQINVAEASRSCDANILYQEDGYGVPANESSRSKKQKPSAVSHPPHKSKQVSSAGELNKSEKSTRQLRKRTAAPQRVEEPEDEINGSFPSEPPSTSIADEDNDYDYRVDEDAHRSDITSQKKKASKKSQVPAAKNQNRGKRRKRDNNDAQEISTQAPKKKFSHSTLRKNRLKELLSIPEDEVDFQTLPFKDIIMLAGYKENLAVKEAKASKDASTAQRSNNSAHGEESLNEEDAGTSEQDGGYAEDQTNMLFNHNSFMDKTPKSRWSKQDTELFYEGLRQFGTDLSMIQQLFPGKTRHQMKLKYKKEERQYPLRLSEALATRAKDNSYFEKVIEQMQLASTPVEHESNKDGSAGASDEEDELNPETNEHTAKPERGGENVTVEDNLGNRGGVPSPKHDEEEEEEDDDDIFSSYQCVVD